MVDGNNTSFSKKSIVYHLNGHLGISHKSTSKTLLFHKTEDRNNCFNSIKVQVKRSSPTLPVSS